MGLNRIVLAINPKTEMYPPIRSDLAGLNLIISKITLKTLIKRLIGKKIFSSIDLPRNPLTFKWMTLKSDAAYICFSSSDLKQRIVLHLL